MAQAVASSNLVTHPKFSVYSIAENFALSPERSEGRSAFLTCMSWFVYIIDCRDHTLYTGITNDLKHRIRDHNSGNGCRYTKYRYPVKLIHSEEYPTKAEALKREARIKHLTRFEKLTLIQNR